MKISQKAKCIEPSLTRKLFNMAKKYEDVIDLTLGDPDLIPDKRIQNAAIDAIKDGKTRYSANAGLIELRKTISEQFSTEYGLSINPNNEIIVTVGGMEALYLSLSSLVDPGDEVIVLAPYYVNYVQMIRMCGGNPVIVYTDEKSGFQCNRDQLENAVTNKTVAIIINTPCNPTGTILNTDSLSVIADVAKKNDLTIISDEVYRTLIYDDVHHSIINLDGMRDKTILIDSLSKRFSMTGYRLGYAIAPEQMIASMTKMQENVVACAPLPSQYAGIAAYKLCSDNTSIQKVFAQRRDTLYENINSIKMIHCTKPQGAFYLFVNIHDTGMDGLSFAYKLLEKEHVAVVPGVSYGERYTDYIRIAYTLDIPVLKEATMRIKRLINEIE